MGSGVSSTKTVADPSGKIKVDNDPLEERSAKTGLSKDSDQNETLKNRPTDSAIKEITESTPTSKDFVHLTALEEAKVFAPGTPLTPAPPKVVSAAVKKVVADILERASHWDACTEFPCDECCEHSREVERHSQNRRLDRDSTSDHLAEATDFCRIFSATWEKLQFDIILSEDHDEWQMHYNFFICLLGGVWNFTNHSTSFCMKMEDCGCIRLLIDWMLQLEDEPSMSKRVKSMVLDSLNIFHNIVRTVRDLRQRCRVLVPTLQKFGNSADNILQTIAFLTLSYVIRKEEAHMVSINDKCLNTLLSLLKKALRSNSKDHCVSLTVRESATSVGACMSFSALELIQGIEQLAINDDNKGLIARKNGIETIGGMLTDKFTLEERACAADTLWRLAFLPDNKERIRSQEDIVKALTKYATDDNEQLKNASMGALFEIYGSKLPEELSGSKVTDGTGMEGSPTEGGLKTSHIMISYKWENPSKPVMREIKLRLRKMGYNVWMDEDHMKGDKIGAMADAVENADIVLACISPGYQDSQDCRSEASYAYECRKKIVPIKVDANFNASRWLGGIVAGKIYYVVPSVPKVAEVLPVIIEKEIGDMGKLGTKAVDETDSPMAPKVEASVRSEVTKWGIPEVQKWLATNDVTTKNKQLQKLNGTQLLQLKKQHGAVPDFFYKSLKEDLKLDFSTILSLTAALEQLED